jgi:hypothetical protein
MAVEVYMDEIETDAIGGFDRVAPGSYHMKIVGLDEDGGKKGEMTVDFEVLRGTTANQEGKVHREFFPKTSEKTARKKMLSLAIACGLTTKLELDKHKAEGTSPNLDFAGKCPGRQVCMNIESSQYNDKTYIRMVWDEVFHPCDKRANHVPLHAAMLKAGGYALPEGRNVDGAVKNAALTTANGGTNAAAAAKAASAAKPAPTGAAAQSVDDLLG